MDDVEEFIESVETIDKLDPLRCLWLNEGKCMHMMGVIFHRQDKEGCIGYSICPSYRLVKR